MRIDLAVPFAEKDQAKSLGARWDPARKIWYVTDPADPSVFAAWLKPGTTVGGASASASGSAPKPAPGTSAKHAEKMAQSFVTPRTDFSLPDTGPDDQPPW